MSEAADLLERSAKEQPSAVPQAVKRSALELLEASAQGEPTHELTGYTKQAPVPAFAAGQAEASKNVGKFIAGAPELVLSGITGSAGTLADVFTNSKIGTHDWTYRPRTAVGEHTEKTVGAVMDPIVGTVSAAWGGMFGKGPTSQAIKSEIADDINIAGSAAGLAGVLRGGVTAAMKRKTPRTILPSESPTAATIEGASEVAKPTQPLQVAETARKPFWEPEDTATKTPPVDSPPVEGGLPDAAYSERASILHRVGLEKARESALRGDVKAASTDFQMKKFDEPAGQAAHAQFEAERAALGKHAESIVHDIGGTLGMSEDALHTRGQSVAAPFDELREWFTQRKSELYQAADQRSGGHPVVETKALEEMLNDRSFNNQMTAQNQTHLVNGIKAEIERFKEANGGKLTVQQAEQFRQFLNTLWNKDNSSTIGKLKGRLDEDVLAGAGEDIYSVARKLSESEKRTLDDPNGVAKLFDHDPRTPINRATAHEKMPDTLLRLPVAQFENVLKTLKDMPEQVQPAAQQAMAEIRAQIANKVMEAGESTKGQWNATAVSRYLKQNSAKIKTAFADNPEALAKISDLNSAGKILQADGSYPGAAAQAANSLKRGLMSQALTKLGSTAGAGVGSTMGPLGAVGGAFAGELAGSRMGASLGEKSALRNWDRSTTDLKELLANPNSAPGFGVRKK